MNESQVLEFVETEIQKSTNGFKVEVISRNFNEKCSEYVATIAVIGKDKFITESLLANLVNAIAEGGITWIKIVGTVKDLQQLDFEVLTLEAEINL